MKSIFPNFKEREIKYKYKKGDKVLILWGTGKGQVATVYHAYNDAFAGPKYLLNEYSSFNFSESQLEFDIATLRDIKLSLILGNNCSD